MLAWSQTGPYIGLIRNHMDTYKLPITMFSKTSGSLFSCKAKGIRQLGITELGHLIREGYEIYVTTLEGMDYTMETLVRIAYQGAFTTLHNDGVEALASTVDEEMLYNIINNGGIKNYLHRKARGCLID